MVLPSKRSPVGDDTEDVEGWLLALGEDPSLKPLKPGVLATYAYYSPGRLSSCAYTIASALTSGVLRIYGAENSRQTLRKMCGESLASIKSMAALAAVCGVVDPVSAHSPDRICDWLSPNALAAFKRIRFNSWWSVCMATDLLLKIRSGELSVRQTKKIIYKSRSIALSSSGPRVWNTAVWQIGDEVSLPAHQYWPLLQAINECPLPPEFAPLLVFAGLTPPSFSSF